MKKIIIIVLLTAQAIFSQNAEKKVWDLLLANKRTEAKKLFDKEFKNIASTKIEYFLLGQMIELEQGKFDFDESFISTFSKFDDSKYYLTSLLQKQFILGDINSVGFNDNTYKKVDALILSDNFKNIPVVKYYKAVADRSRKNYQGFNENVKKLNSIMNWQLCGAFENLNDSGLNIEYEPEIYAKNDKLFDANSNGKLGWYNPKVIQNEGYHTFSNEDEYGNGIMYSQIFIENPIEQDVVLNFGMSGSLKFFINDVEIYANTQNKVSDLNAYKLKIKLPKGFNRLLVKSSITPGNNYFYLALTDVNNNSLENIVYHPTYKEYYKSTLAALNVQELIPDYEDYFIKKIVANPENVFYKIMLYDAYIHNKKVELATDLIEELDQKYHNSSMIKTRLIEYYSSKDDNVKVNEISKNIELQDPDYFFTIATKAQDTEWLKSTSITELENYRDRAKKITSPLLGLLFDFLIHARNTNTDAMLKSADDILANTFNGEFYIKTFAPLYDTLGKNKEKAIQMLEDLYRTKDNFSALSLLVRYYKAAGKDEEIKKLFVERKQNYPYFTGVASDYINVLIDEKQYDEALKEINNSLELYPYSFQLLEKKGNILILQRNLKEAEKFIRKSLEHNSENSDLRKQLYDITKTPDEIESIDVKDKYKLIKERRGSKMKSDYGVATLFDQYIVNILPEGGRKSKVVLIYEIVAENGIEEMKEYSLNDYSLTLQKSEIVKQNSTIVPAEKGSGVLVFSNLEIGDVIYIEYEAFDNGTGRFYRDFNLNCYFNSTYPTEETIFAIINPENVQYQNKIFNGQITPTVKKINDRTSTIWRSTKGNAMPLLESYSKNYSDLTNTIAVSSIKSWKEISNWYADLVKKTLTSDKITKSTFDQIFAKGVLELSKEQIAKKIYAYILENINYSSLDFRQSGYVPQKPSKTITTKLGDCKDVSTLFVALSQLAGLKSNLVLISTNDNSSNSMSLPSRDFNHCIVKVSLDDKDYFLELTDKFLPFKSLPMSLYQAKSLVISFDKNENDVASIIEVPFENVTKNQLYTTSLVTVSDKEILYTNTQKVIGANKSYYNELFSNSTSDDVRKNDLEDLYAKKLDKTVKLTSDKLISNTTYDSAIEFETQLKVTEKLKSVGSLKIIDMPFIDKVYTRDIIASDTRNYDINYHKYENNNEYFSTIIVTIDDTKKFTELLENKNFKYKNHEYKIVFELEKHNKLKIIRTVTTPWDNIAASDYPEFKKYVEEVLTVEEQVIGFK